jgi:hypothetical protein
VFFELVCMTDEAADEVAAAIEDEWEHRIEGAAD